jgi:predicted anti-sigma-YlaC factor YlaD
MNPARTMTCREAAKLLFGAYENQMSPEDRARLEAHIAECEACVRVRDQAEFMRRAMERWRRYREAE